MNQKKCICNDSGVVFTSLGCVQKAGSFVWPNGDCRIALDRAINKVLSNSNLNQLNSDWETWKILEFKDSLLFSLK